MPQRVRIIAVTLFLSSTTSGKPPELFSDKSLAVVTFSCSKGSPRPLLTGTLQELYPRKNADHHINSTPPKKSNLEEIHGHSPNVVVNFPSPSRATYSLPKCEDFGSGTGSAIASV